ncbi:MAG: gliding motility-associated C-terminal domain-containing protein [Bacteroidota bacterium]|nr:gliding motility-associated C-terminal domain-containing protein [Bacteroidota bacterium]
MEFKLIRKIVYDIFFSIKKGGAFVLLLFLFFSSVQLHATNTFVSSAPFPVSFTVSDYNGFGVSCNGSTDGFIDLTINGGVAPFDVSWSNSAITEDISGLTAGTYTVIIIDAVQDTTIDSVLITEPAVIDITFQSVTPVSCNGNSDGAIDMTPSGGTGGYSFQWSQGAITEDIIGLDQGAYTVSVTDANNCITQGDTLISEPDPIQILFSGISNVKCNGFADGVIDITALGGTGNYSFQWNQGAITEDISGLTAGPYTVSVTDVNNCVATSDTIITEPNALVIVFASVTPITCNGLTDGVIDITSTGGTGTYSYQWNQGAVTEDLNGLNAGTYTVSVNDINNCQAESDTLITEPDALEIIFSSVTAITCNGFSDGTINMTPLGGTGAYAFQWNQGSVSEDLSGLDDGTYSVSVTDDNNCVAEADTIITEPDAITVAFTSVASITCFGLTDGAIDITPSGGTGSYTFLWNDGSIAEDLSGLDDGNYSVSVTDDNNCLATVDTIITEPPVVALDFTSVTPITCNGFADGSINITPSGGTGAFAFQWSDGTLTEDISGLNAGIYSISVSDINNCFAEGDTIITEPDEIVINLTTQDANAAPDGEASVSPVGGTGSFAFLWSNGATTSLITGLLPGNYTITVTDANLCTVTEVATINNALGGCSIVTDSIVNVRCNGQVNGAIYISNPGAFAPVSYFWSNGAITQDITGLAQGTYTVTITDAVACTATQSFTITQPPILNATANPVSETCAADNGSISTNVTGGTGSYSYLWSNGALTPAISGLNGATYTVTVTDQNGCTKVTSSVVTAITPPQVVVDSVRNVACFGGATGAVFTTVSNGSLPYSVVWSNGQTSQDITGLIAGTYTVTVTDADLCTATTNAVVTQPAAVLNDSVQTVRPTCGNNNGSVTVFPYNGTSPYTYLWNNSQTTQTISGLAPGSYTVTITDANLCTRQRSVVLTNIAGPVASLDSVRAVRCFGGATGGVFISVSGGTLPLTYVWSNAAITQDISNVIAGTYTVTVTDANSCTSVTSGIVTQPLAALNDSVNTIRPSCGISNGSITSYPYSGTSPYTYLWNTSQTTQTISGLAPGTYTVTITDANLCTRQRSVVLSNIGGPVASVDSVRAVRCFGGATGGVFISVSGGTLPLTYVWSNAAITQDITNVIAGTYTVTVTDASSCSSVTSGIVTQPLAALNDSVQTVRPTCGNNNGSVTVFPYNGTSPYTYLWNNSQTTQTIFGLAPGSYTVTITDANLCTRQRSVVLTNIAGPVASLDSVRAVRCFGGTTGGVFISATGGTLPLTYLWSNAAITQDISNVIAGTYTVTVTDANLCTASVSGIVTQPAAALNDSIRTVNPTCGNTNGSATVFPYGGTGPYTYLWSNLQTTQTISGLTTGSYTVTITDANLCTRQRIASLINIGGPTAVVDSIRNVRCFGGATGAVYITVTGGTLPYTYLWSNGAVTQDLVNVVSGTKIVTVTDANTCTASANGIITQPAAALADSVNSIRPTCGLNNGSITIYPFNGTSPYTYLWNNGLTTQTISGLAAGTYTVTTTDANLCTRLRTTSINLIAPLVATLDSVKNVRCFGTITGAIYVTVTGGTAPRVYQWTNGASTQDLTNVAAGTYTLTVTDANLCTSVVNATITQPAAISDSVQVTNATCSNANGGISIFPFGGTPGYTYLWNNSQTTSTISALASGTYTVTVTDASLCTRVRAVNVINIPGPVGGIDSTRNVRCFGGSTGSVFVTVTGSAVPLTYQWSNSAVTQDLLNVPVGTYTVTVTDANNCTITIDTVLSQPALISVNSTVTNAACSQASGAITAAPSGGVSPYIYLWNNGMTTPSINGLLAGNYTVTVTDANSCTSVKNATVGSIGPPVIALDSIRNVRCNGGATGGIFISLTGGTPPFTYQWTGGTVSQDLVNVIAGTYTVIVTDSNACGDTLTATITQPALLNDSIQVANALCGAPTGSATVFPFGGTSPYSYLWSTGSALATVFALNAGSYTVTITDAFGCTKQDVANISSSGGPVVTIDSIRNVKCFGALTGGVFISVGGGTSPYSYLWSNNAITQDLSNVGAGTYTVTVTDDNNCVVIVSGTITQPPALNDSTVAVNSSCGLANGSITTYPYGGVPPYTLLWNTGLSTPTISGLLAGIYTVTVTDFNGCTFVQRDTVFGTNVPLVVVDSIFNVSCFNGTNGSIYITASGGTGTLSYLWSDGTLTQDLLNTDAGTYTVTVTDQNSCTAIISATIQQPAAIGDSAQITPEACNSINGAINLFPGGGTPPYSFFWNTGSITEDLTGIVAGTYTVTITDSLGCQLIASYVVPAVGSPQIVLDSIQQISCFGGTDGAIYISITGGSVPFLYNWSNSALSQDVINLQAGNYSVIVTDTFLCADTAFFVITEPAVLQDSVTFISASCGLANGSATIYPYGGTPQYTYLWSDGQLTQTAINLPAGPVTVTVTDDNLCTITETITITDQPVHIVTVDSVVNVSCFGVADGGIYITVSGGSGTFGYLWSNAAITEDLTGVIADSYTVTVTDSNACSVTQTFTITQPDLLTDSTEVSDATCGLANGAATIFPIGGTGPFTYMWNTNAVTQSISNLLSAVYTVTVTDFNGCTLVETIAVGDVGGPNVVLDSLFNTSCFNGANGAIYISVTSGLPAFNYLWSNFAITQDITGLIAGIYSLTVTDQSNCQQFISFTVEQPDALQDSSVISPASCGALNGTITEFPYGGVGPYSFLWNTMAVTQTVTGLAAGTYTVTVTDSNNCTLISQYVINNMNGPSITVDSLVQVNCEGDSTGAIYISVTNGTAPYTYLWSDTQIIQDVINITAGTYTVTVTDFNQCTSVITNVINEPPPVEVIFTSTPSSCNASNGSITAMVSGGVPGYDLLWNTTAVTPGISNLAAGVYTLTVTDQNNCVNIFNVSVNNISAPVITVVDSGNVSCSGANDGFITVSVSGGAAPYNYSWSNTTQNGNQLTALAGNVTYTLTIIDSLGCIAIRPVFISEPATFTINGIIPQLNGTFNLTCFGSNDGSIDLVVSGGTDPYSYLWSNFALTDSIGGLSAGNYTVTVTDDNGCTASQSFTLTQPPLLVSNAGPNKVICGLNSDTLNADVPTFGTGTWIVVSGSGTFANPNQPNTIVTNLTNGVNVFQWVVTDGICSAFSQVVISFSTQINAIAGVNKEVCENSALLTATAPQFGYGYWQIVNSQATINDTSDAVTAVTGLNFGANVFRWFVLNGTCIDSADVTIFLNDPDDCFEELELPTGFTPNGDGKNDYFFVKGLDDYPENSIVVFNRWGNKVYEKGGYTNDWNGTNNSGDPLPDGTYFVIFKVRTIDRIITTYVDLRR